MQHLHWLLAFCLIAVLIKPPLTHADQGVTPATAPSQKVNVEMPQSRSGEMPASVSRNLAAEYAISSLRFNTDASDAFKNEYLQSLEIPKLAERVLPETLGKLSEAEVKIVVDDLHGPLNLSGSPELDRLRIEKRFRETHLLAHMLTRMKAVSPETQREIEGQVDHIFNYLVKRLDDATAHKVTADLKSIEAQHTRVLKARIGNLRKYSLKRPMTEQELTDLMSSLVQRIELEKPALRAASAQSDHSKWLEPFFRLTAREIRQHTTPPEFTSIKPDEISPGYSEMLSELERLEKASAAKKR